VGKIFVFSDGGAIGNPGPAAVGVIVKDEKGRILASFGKFIGHATNNIAEYQGVIKALKWIKEKGQISPSFQIHFFLDSRLVVNQLRGIFKVKEAKLRELILKIRGLEQELGGDIFYHLVPRKKNFLADLEVKKVLFP